MGTDAPTTQIAIRDQRKRGWYWTGNETQDIYLRIVGASAWCVYDVLCRFAGVDREVQISHQRLMEQTGFSLPTIIDKLDLLASAEIALIAIEHRQTENGRQLSNVYTLLEPILVGPRKVDVTKPEHANGSGQSDLWALRPLEAAIAELQSAPNKLAVVARLYAMRFDAQTYPFDFARGGALTKKLSGGAVRLCQIIWHANPETVRGNPMDYLTVIAYKEIKAPPPALTTVVEREDPQVAAVRAMGMQHGT